MAHPIWRIIGRQPSKHLDIEMVSPPNISDVPFATKALSYLLGLRSLAWLYHRDTVLQFALLSSGVSTYYSLRPLVRQRTLMAAKAHTLLGHCEPSDRLVIRFWPQKRFALRQRSVRLLPESARSALSRRNNLVVRAGPLTLFSKSFVEFYSRSAQISEVGLRTTLRSLETAATQSSWASQKICESLCQTNVFATALRSKDLVVQTRALSLLATLSIENDANRVHIASVSKIFPMLHEIASKPKVSYENRRLIAMILYNISQNPLLCQYAALEGMYSALIRIYKQEQWPVLCSRMLVPATLGNFHRFAEQQIEQTEKYISKDPTQLAMWARRSEEPISFEPHHALYLERLTVRPALASLMGYIGAWILFRVKCSNGGFDSARSLTQASEFAYRYSVRTAAAAFIWGAAQIGYGLVTSKYLRYLDPESIEKYDWAARTVGGSALLLLVFRMSPFVLLGGLGPGVSRPSVNDSSYLNPPQPVRLWSTGK